MRRSCAAKPVRRRWHTLAGLVLALAAAGAAVPSRAAPTPDESAEAAPSFSPRGADTCIKCHDDAHVKSIFDTPHGRRADARTPFAQAQCESCHGPGGEHAQRLRPGNPRPPIPLFGKHSTASVAQQNGACLSCHQGGHRVDWQGSVHEREDVACVSCHTVHAEHDPVMSAREQPQVCAQCHRAVRADFEKFSAHPVREGAMQCTSCHAAHDAMFAAMLHKPTINQTCYTCHADLRGPFLWEHPPVAEDCANCHVPHGSPRPALLTRRPPQLCQQCHSAADHPGLPFTGRGLAGGASPSAFVLGGSCTNCHSHVHGSNAPSGADLSR